MNDGFSDNCTSCPSAVHVKWQGCPRWVERPGGLLCPSFAYGNHSVCYSKQQTSEKHHGKDTVGWRLCLLKPIVSPTTHCPCVAVLLYTHTRTHTHTHTHTVLIICAHLEHRYFLSFLWIVCDTFFIVPFVRHALHYWTSTGVYLDAEWTLHFRLMLTAVKPIWSQIRL